MSLWEILHFVQDDRCARSVDCTGCFDDDHKLSVVIPRGARDLTIEAWIHLLPSVTDGACGRSFTSFRITGARDTNILATALGNLVSSRATPPNRTEDVLCLHDDQSKSGRSIYRRDKQS
jgi:hypothetical protein